MKRLFLILPVILAACAAPSTLMRNDVTGQIIDCRSLGIGLIGSAMAVGVQQNCVDKYKTNGFHEISMPGPFTAAGKDGTIQLALPKGWAVYYPPPDSPEASAQINAREIHARLDLAVVTVDRNDVNDLKVFANILRSNVFKGDAKSRASDIFETTVNGNPAIIFDASGGAQGTNVHVVATVVRLNRVVAIITVRTLASNFPGLRSEMDALASGLSEPTATEQAASKTLDSGKAAKAGGKFVSGDGRLQLELSSNWRARPGAVGTAVPSDRILLMDQAAGGTIIVSSVDGRDVSDMLAFVEAGRANDANQMPGSTVSPVEMVSVNGRSAYRYTITATLSGVNIHFVVTILRLDSRVANVVASVTESKFAEHRFELEAVAANLTELPAAAMAH